MKEELDYQRIGIKIKELRKQHNLTHKELGDKIRKLPYSVREYEKGLRVIPSSVLSDLAEIFNLQLEDLIS